MTLVRAERLRAPGAAPKRSCGPCTVCCTVMAVPELHKPSRRACDHVRQHGCAVHAERPASCRAFHCAWLRGVLVDEHARPDLLGVMIDYFEAPDDRGTHLLAFELWEGALDTPASQAMLCALAALHVVTVLRRDGRLSTLVDDQA